MKVMVKKLLRVFNNFMKYKKGDVLKREGEKMEILDVCGRAYLVKSWGTGQIRVSYGVTTDEQLDEEGYTLITSFPWVPEKGDMYWFVANNGSFIWENYLDMPEDKYRLSVGNCHLIREDAEVYKQKLENWAKGITPCVQ